MMFEMLDEIERAYATFCRWRVLIVAWFVRLSWPAVMVWGAIDAVRYVTGGSEEVLEDATIRLFSGTALFLVWLFLVRTRGPLTLNRGGRLESPGDR